LFLLLDFLMTYHVNRKEESTIYAKNNTWNAERYTFKKNNPKWTSNAQNGMKFKGLVQVGIHLFNKIGGSIDKACKKADTGVWACRGCIKRQCRRWRVETKASRRRGCVGLESKA
jgi:hypothetical protein